MALTVVGTGGCVGVERAGAVSLSFGSEAERYFGGRGAGSKKQFNLKAAPDFPLGQFWDRCEWNPVASLEPGRSRPQRLVLHQAPAPHTLASTRTAPPPPRTRCTDRSYDHGHLIGRIGRGARHPGRRDVAGAPPAGSCAHAVTHMAVLPCARVLPDSNRGLGRPQDTLRYFRQAGVDLDATTQANDGRTAVCAAAADGNTSVVLTLGAAGADLEKPDIDGSSPLLLACMEGHADTVDALLHLGALADTADDAGFTPLFVAAQEGHTAVVQSLIGSGGTSVDVPSGEGATPLAIASECGHADVVRLLAASGSAVDAPNGSGATPLYMACQAGDLSMVRLLIELGADPQRRRDTGATPFYISCEQGHLHVVDYLATLEVDFEAPMSDGSNPLYICSQNGHTAVAEALLSRHGVSVDTPRDTGATPFLIACEEGHHEVARLLADHKADINRPNNAGATPFYVACQNGHDNIVELLVELCANITAPLANGATPMLVACERNHTEVVHRLMRLNLEPPMLQNRADLDEVNNTRWSSGDDNESDNDSSERPAADSTAPADYLGQCRLDVHPEPAEDSAAGEWKGVPLWLSGAIAAVTPAKAKADGSSPKAWAGVWSAGDILSKVTGSGGSRTGSEDGDAVDSFISSSGSEGDADSLEVV